jgi:hypothetical protein
MLVRADLIIKHLNNSFHTTKHTIQHNNADINHTSREI